jgi:hypothetical protein
MIIAARGQQAAGRRGGGNCTVERAGDRKGGPTSSAWIVE